MSVPMGTRQYMRWIQLGEIGNPPASFQTKILGDRHAEVAFQKITRRGVKAELIWKILWELAHRNVESNWHSVPGLPLSYLRRLPTEAACKFTTYHAPKARALFRSNLEFALIGHVKKATGKPYFLQIARLLSAAYYALGSPEIVDDHNLRKRYHRRH